MMKDRFLRYCKLTCIGGSESGTCPCKHPKECNFQKDPEFDKARTEAKERMWQYFKNKLPGEN